MGAKKQKWSIGDLFAIPRKDGRYIAGQVIGREPEVLNSVSVALFDEVRDQPEQVASVSLSEDRLFSSLFATRDLLDSGYWKVVHNRPVSVPTRLFPFERTRASGFVGAKVIGSAIVNEFVNAYFALVPWDDWKDPTYLDKLLVSPAKKPVRLLLKGSPSA